MQNNNPLPPLDVPLEVFLTKEWVEQALKYSGIITADQSVISVTAAPLTGGFSADTQRLTLEYSNSAEGAPRSIVAKYPSSNEGSRDAGSEHLSYAREVNFYKFLAPKLKMRLAECYFSEIEEGTANFCLMLEDLQPADMIDGQRCSEARARASMRELALLHAGTWQAGAENDTNSQQYDWIFDFSDADYFATVKPLAVGGVPKLINEFKQAQKNGLAGAEQVPPNLESSLEAFAQKLDKFRQAVATRPLSLMHGDYRLSNLLYKGEDVSIAVDWQTYQMANPGFDTFYFLREACPEGVETANGRSLMEAYYRTLLENGVSGYSRKQCMEDYYFGLLYSVFMVLATVETVGANGLPEPLLLKVLDGIPTQLKQIDESRILDTL